MPRNIPVPANISESSIGFSTLIVVRWNRGKVVSPIFSLLNVLIVFFVVYAVSGVSYAHSWVERLQEIWITPRLNLLLPALVAGLIGYGLLLQFHNRTEILITESDLKISIRPIFAWGNMTLQKSEICQLFVHEKSIEKQDDQGFSRCSKSYELRWVDSQNKGRILIGKLLAQEALYLEKRLEKLLGLSDQSVKGGFFA